MCVMFLSVHIWSQIEGKIVAPKPWEGDRDDSEEAWLEFADVDGLLVDGKGEIDGRGGAWWKSCPVVPSSSFSILLVGFLYPLL